MHIEADAKVVITCFGRHFREAPEAQEIVVWWHDIAAGGALVPVVGGKRVVRGAVHVVVVGVDVAGGLAVGGGRRPLFTLLLSAATGGHRWSSGRGGR